MYATLEDMHTRFGADALLQQAPTEDGALSLETVDAALADASELIESHVASRYLLPLSPVPAPVRRWCVDVAYYYLHRYEPPKSVRQAYEDALAGLKAVARGDIVLQCAGVQAPAPQSGFDTAVQGTGPSRLFSAGTLGGF